MYAHAAACVTVRVCPAIVSVPVRELVAVLTAAAYVTVPLPVPLLPLLIDSHVALLVAVHPQTLVVVTEAVELPPAAATLCVVGDSV